jgi:hypothetical protein
MENEKTLEQVLVEFREFRDRTIDDLLAKKVEKNEFIKNNLDFFNNLGYVPKEGKLHSMEEGIFNYQYYNTMAKEANMIARELKYKDPFKAKDLRDKALRYYKKKDRETVKMLNFINFKGVRAYYIKTQSVSLRNTIYEIIVDGYDRVVFHSTDEKIKQSLIMNKVFLLKQQKSIIDDYVNTLY